MEQMTLDKTTASPSKHARREARATARSGSMLGLSATGFHEIAYVEWGPASDPRPVLCVHGVSRQGRDFDYLAADLAGAGRRVICPDLPGRGKSEYLIEPDDYSLVQYCADMNALIARSGASHVDWVGTSLGGLIGIILAGMPGSCIRRLVVNDIGPYVSSIGLMRIGTYLREMPRSFATMEQAEAYFREILAPYGALGDEHWRHITRHSVEWDETRSAYVLLCDPNVSGGFRNVWYASLNIWKYWEQIRVPILVLHGVKSDLLTLELTQDMVARNRRAAVHRFEECGHVPPLFEPHQIKVVTDFLAGNQPPAPG